MASFAKATFDVGSYLASRPTYPKKVYDVILAHHRSRGGRFDHLVDLGCGPGFVALSLSPHFRHTTALDPSKKMVEVGLQPSDPTLPRIQYKVGTAEKLIEEGVKEADLVVAGQAAHWFDHQKTWTQLSKVVRPGGTVAYIGYAEPVFPTHPQLDHIYHHFSSQIIGPYWSQPGRSIVENLLNAVPFPITPIVTDPPLRYDLEEGGMSPVRITEPPTPNLEENNWDPTTAIRLRHTTERPWLMKRSMTLDQFEGYLRSNSAVHEYRHAHPDEKTVAEGGDGDVVDRVMVDIRKGLEGVGVGDKENGQEEFEVGWPLVVMMIKKKE
ncbi:hypothetical protein CI109_105344 [Kwoniella shandongensis]|uniref:Uncharacterized protein n=1 Tax=Kwoniella shandongensis TaxID=1734106 RepID=A0A5M6BRM5_9TREE|nr:uncharacterized protein CI109_006929 [Kwoniella shandongensis]KAA5524722.1 hypothetical protein CI109_006929 [Kwoniella shandongensis]